MVDVCFIPSIEITETSSHPDRWSMLTTVRRSKEGVVYVLFSR